MNQPTPMAFKRFGRSHHLVIRTAGDLESVPALAVAHWMAISAPIDTITCDRVFLVLVDTDHNGRILAYEMRDAILWLLETLKDHHGIDERSDVLRLDDINTRAGGEGERILESARKMLRSLGTPDAERITLGQVREIKARVESNPVSEAGVVIPQATEDEEVRRFIADVASTLGGVPHPSGANGVNAATLDDFLDQSRAYLEWLACGDVPQGKTRTDVMPLGPDTPAAYAKLDALRDKIDQFFAQCEAVALDETLAGRLGPRVDQLDQTDFGDPAAIRLLMGAAPLATPTAERVLAFGDEVNPYYTEKLDELRREAIEPALGRSARSLSQDDWEEVKAFFAAHRQWLSRRPSEVLEALGADRLRTYLDDRFAYAVKSLMAESADTAFVLDNIRQTEKLILCQAHMLDLANNFVSFPDLYDPSRRAMFEMGSLVMDGRRFNMAVKVENRAEHVKVAKSSNMYVMYVDVFPRDGRPKYEVAVPVTHHGRGNLVVGKRGLFVECDDSEHDARVAQIIEDPISIGEAICAPFKRVGRLMTGKIEALTADAEKTLDKTVTKGAPAAAPAKQPKPAGGSAGSLLMGGGVAVAALGSSLAYITNTFAGPNIWKLFVGIGGAVVAVMLPTVILAIVKLRRRDLSALLEGSGWAVNARMRLTRRQARFFAEKPPYPEDARGIRRWTRWVVLTVILIVIAGALAWWQGCKLRAKRQAEDTAKEKLQQNKDAGKDQSPALKATPADQAKGK